MKFGQDVPDINIFYKYFDEERPVFEKKLKILENASQEDLHNMVSNPGLFSVIPI